MLRLGPAPGSFPRPLPAKTERELAERAASGDLEARNKLIEHNLRLVAHIVKKYYTSAADTEDLISIGTVGLIKGVSTYRPDKGVRLATYAARCVENEILMYFRAQRRSAGDISLNEALDTDSEGNSLSLMDVLAVSDDMAEELSLKESCSRLRECVETALTERERRVIRLRYGLGGAEPLTQRECAERLGISRSYVSRIEKRAIARLREALG
ncbi:MAG TPA: RNA polymerase sporulation sigma factor SigK [Candidatus Scatomorpha merdipullorum]|uniref:RNA polymerase sporulation sigma factor SigK n=1 Tax=Candidatus Scatomorpha merdipullorum TaxID=2840927 RepID=A0A9D1FE51_9FIRM|nr:RNA polymerase sporulation sigma factor SigK [Candidatus Scatomorpha merdipullorum]